MAADSFEISGSLRTETGKGAARRARFAGLVPGVLYSRGKTTIGINVTPKELSKGLLGPKRRNVLFDLSLKDASGKTSSHAVMVKELQIDVIRRSPIHVDFLEVQRGKPVKAQVPLEVTGKSQAIVQGAKMQIVLRSIWVNAAPELIPEKLVIDITSEGFGVVKADKIPMPEGVSLVTSAETPVVSLRMPRGDIEEVAAAPAAAAKAPAAAGKAAPGAAAAAAPAKKK